MTTLPFRRSTYLLSLWFLSLIFIMGILALGRWALWIFAANTEFFTDETWLAWQVGIRFDMMVAAYFTTPVLVCWLLSLIIPKKRKSLLRIGSAATLGLGTILLGIEIVNFGFFCEYQDQFNVWVLGMANDDAAAIFQTIAEDYHWERYLLALILSVAIFITLFLLSKKRLLLCVTKHNRSLKLAAFLTLTAVVTAVIFYRGGTNRRPVRLRDAAVCQTDTINNLVLNPAYALKHVLIDTWKISNGGKAPDFVRNIPTQAKLLFGEKAKEARTIDSLFTVKNERLRPNARAPKQVYLFLMESYDRWPMLEKYARLGLCDSLRELEKAGASSPNFVSADNGTMLTLTTLMSGIPNISVAQNYRPNGSVALPTATAKIFKQLGYKTRFAYCGYGLWQRVESYARDQGFDEIVLGNNVPNCPEEYKGEWGVPDHFLFSHLEQLVKADGDTPVFTLVLSASYHPPYNLPLEKFGCESITIPKALSGEFDESTPINTLNHFKYSDQALGTFIKNVSAGQPSSVFAVTGDHFSRRFLNKNPTLSERKQVPFVLVGENVPAGTQLPFGTHADIVPTLLALCAPDGFEYPTFGVNLFSEKARSRKCAFGADTILHSAGGMRYGAPLVHYGKMLDNEEAASMKARVDALRALAWTYFEKGNELSEEKH